MKTFINKLVQLADGLDSLGLKKDADKLDQLVAKATRGEDFGDLMSLFDEPLMLEHEEDKGPSAEKVVLDAPEIHTPLDEEEAPLSQEKAAPSRRDLLMRRHKILQLQKEVERAEKLEKALEQEEPEAESLEARPKLDLDALPDETVEDSFEDEDDEEVNESDDIMDSLKDMLVELPEHGKTLLNFIKSNPEIVEALMAVL